MTKPEILERIAGVQMYNAETGYHDLMVDPKALAELLAEMMNKSG